MFGFRPLIFKGVHYSLGSETWVGCGPLQAAAWYADSRSRGGAWRSSPKMHISVTLAADLGLGDCHSNVCIICLWWDMHLHVMGVMFASCTLVYLGWYSYMKLHFARLERLFQGDMDLEELVSAHCVRLQTQRHFRPSFSEVSRQYDELFPTNLQWYNSNDSCCEFMQMCIVCVVCPSS